MTTITTLPLDQILQRSDFNPRDSAADSGIATLAASIKARGFLQPIVVRQAEDGYWLVDGERRFLAAHHLDLVEVPVIVREYEDDERRESQELIDAVTANAQRVQLTPVEEGQAFVKLRAEKFSVAEIATQMGVTQAIVKDRLALLTLPGEVLQLVADGKLQQGHVKVLLGMLPYGTHLAVRMAEAYVESDITAKLAAERPIWIKGCNAERGLWVTTGYVPLESIPLNDAMKDTIDALDAFDACPSGIDLEPADIVEGITAGCIYGPTFDHEALAYQRAPVVITSREWLVSKAEDELRAHAKEMEQHKAADAEVAQAHAGTIDSPDEVREPDGTVRPKSELEQKVEREQAKREELKLRRAAQSRNLAVGQKLMENLPEKVTLETALTLAGIVLEKVGANRLADNGVAFLLPQFATIEGEGEKGKPFHNKQGARKFVNAFVCEGTTPDEVIGRLMAILVSVEVVDKGAATPSTKPYSPIPEWKRETLLPFKDAIKGTHANKDAPKYASRLKELAASERAEAQKHAAEAQAKQNAKGE